MEKPKTPKERAAELVAEGYQQISRKYRRLVQVPPMPEGMDPLQALRSVSPETYEKLMEQTRKRAASEYFMYFWSKGHNSVELDPVTFHEYLLATGRNPGPLYHYDEFGRAIGPYTESDNE